MPKHIVRLLILMVLFAAFAYGAKQYFTVGSYYSYGHYRGNAVADIASDKPKFKGSASCAPCHAEQSTEWSSGVHNSAELGKVVKCEVCHGAGGERDVKGPFEPAPTGRDHPDHLKLAIPTDTAKLCTLCHEQMAGRPAQQKQIVVATHAGTLQCTTCHDPHSPRTIAGAVLATAPPGDPAAGKAMAAVCAGCHGAPAAAGPSLDGQREAYLADAIRAYKAGLRANPIMLAMVQNLSDANIRDLAAYYAGQSCRSAGNGETAAAAVSAAAIAANCVVCHGADGVSRQPLWPNLAGLSRNYLAEAVKSYRDGGRKNKSMSAMASGLTDINAADLAAYYSNISCR